MCKIDLKCLVSAVAVTTFIALGGCATQVPDAGAVTETDPGRGPMSDAILTDALAGDAEAAFHLYKTTDAPTEKRKWICIAAHRDLPEAQSELARLHWPAPHTPASPFRRDMEKAYAWSLIAIRNGEPVDHIEQRLGSTMTAVERWDATKLAAFWTPDPSQCEDIGDTDCFGTEPVSSPVLLD